MPDLRKVLGERQIKAGELLNLAKALHLDIFQLLSADEAKLLAPVLDGKYPGRDTEVIETKFPLHRHREICGLIS